jgi:hypothetical protein
MFERHPIHLLGENLFEGVIFLLFSYKSIRKVGQKLFERCYYLDKDTSNKAKNLVLYLNQQALQDGIGFAQIQELD